MATKKQKRLAGEAKQRERDAAHEAQIQRRKAIADRRLARKAKRLAEQERHEQNVQATNRMRQAASKVECPFPEGCRIHGPGESHRGE